jgi:hypothetical protein
MVIAASKTATAAKSNRFRMAASSVTISNRGRGEPLSEGKIAKSSMEAAWWLMVF